METYCLCVVLIFLSTTLAFRDPKAFMPFANSYDVHRVDTRSARRYCGSEITRTLTFLCESYNKRSSYPINSGDCQWLSIAWVNQFDFAIADQDSDIGEMDDVNERPRYALTLVKLLGNNDNLKYFRRQVRGVVDDCCKRSCTTTQCKGCWLCPLILVRWLLFSGAVLRCCSDANHNSSRGLNRTLSQILGSNITQW